MSTNTPSADIDPVGTAVRAAVRPRMVPHEIGFMMATAIRGSTTYLAARDILTSELFESGEARYVLLWRSAVAAADASKGMLPQDPIAAKELVAVHCATEIGTDTTQKYYTPSVEHEVLSTGGLLDEIFALPMSQSVEDQGLTFLARFIAERKTGDPLRRALAGISSQSTISDPMQLISILEKHAYEIGGITADNKFGAFGDGLDFVPPGPTVTTTGIEALDELMNGGQAPGEVYALLGPSGGGKSALISQIAVEGSLIQSARAAELGSDQAGHWYYFTWELTEAELKPRFYGYAARVHVDSFKRDPATNKAPALSTSENPASLKPYESDPYVNPPGSPLMGEIQRIQEVTKKLGGPNQRLWIIDNSKNTESGPGSGGVSEIARYLRRETHKGIKIAGVVIDYAGLVVNRYIDKMRLKPNDTFSLLSSFVDEVRSKVAVPYSCPVWVPHQLHGSSTKSAPGRVAHHSEARGCRNFADNASFGIQMGNYIPSTGIMKLVSTKHRRAAGREHGVIVRFDGRFGSFTAPDQKYVVDPMTHAIVPQGFLSTMTANTSNANRRPVVDPRVDI